MLQFNIFGVQIRFKFLFFAIISVVLFTDRSGISFWAFCASLMHEMGHVTCFILCGQKPEEISFECSGIKMKENNSHSTSTLQELIILISGCVVNFAVFIIAKNCGSDNLAMIHLLIGISNLLPVLSLDGGKILLLFLSNIVDISRAYSVVKIISYIFSSALVLIGIYLAYYLNFSLLATGIYLLITLLVEK